MLAQLSLTGLHQVCWACCAWQFQPIAAQRHVWLARRFCAALGGACICNSEQSDDCLLMLSHFAVHRPGQGTRAQRGGHCARFRGALRMQLCATGLAAQLHSGGALPPLCRPASLQQPARRCVRSTAPQNPQLSVRLFPKPAGVIDSAITRMITILSAEPVPHRLLRPAHQRRQAGPLEVSGGGCAAGQ